MNIPNTLLVYANQTSLVYGQKTTNTQYTMDAEISISQIWFTTYPNNLQNQSKPCNLKIVSPNPITELSLETITRIIDIISSDETELSDNIIFSTDNNIFAINRNSERLTQSQYTNFPLFKLANQTVVLEAFGERYSYTFPSTEQASLPQWVSIIYGDVIEFTKVE